MTVIRLSPVPPGSYDEMVQLAAPGPVDADFVLMRGGFRRGDVDLVCGNCNRLLARSLRSSAKARPFIFVCPSCQTSNWLSDDV